MVATVDECLVALSLVRRLQLKFVYEQSGIGSLRLESWKPKDALLTFARRLFDHCWNIVGGPRHPRTLAGKCMIVSAQAIPLPSDGSLIRSCALDEPFRDLIARLPTNYALALLPIVTLRLLCTNPYSSTAYSLLETDFPAHLLTYLVSREAYCEVRHMDFH